MNRNRLNIVNIISAIIFIIFSNVAIAESFEVQAKNNSISGGIGLNTGIPLDPGQLLVVNVDEKDTWSAGEGQRTSNANGLANPHGDNFGYFNLEGFSFLYGSLVGSIDGGITFFPIGTKLDMTILSSGTLSLYYWDSNAYDNTGSVTAVVQVYQGPSW